MVTSYLVLNRRTNFLFSLLYFSFPSNLLLKSPPPATSMPLSRRTTSSGSMGATSSKCSAISSASRPASSWQRSSACHSNFVLFFVIVQQLVFEIFLVLVGVAVVSLVAAELVCLISHLGHLTVVLPLC